MAIQRKSRQYGKPAFTKSTNKDKSFSKNKFRKQLNENENTTRLNNYIANAGICSRRKADEYIKAGLVKINGIVVIEMGRKVKPGDEIKFNDQRIENEKKVYILLNKPKDYITTVNDPKEKKTVMELIKGACKERVYPVGRLDRNTTGVLLLTNDGELTARLSHPKYKQKKIYHVYLDNPVKIDEMQQIVDGLELEDGKVFADAVGYVDEEDKKQVSIELHSGKNRIVRRIFEHLGYKVLKLDRVYFAGLTKKGLQRGQWRMLTEKEIIDFMPNK